MGSDQENATLVAMRLDDGRYVGVGEDGALVGSDDAALFQPVESDVGAVALHVYGVGTFVSYLDGVLRATATQIGPNEAFTLDGHDGNVALNAWPADQVAASTAPGPALTLGTRVSLEPRPVPEPPSPCHSHHPDANWDDSTHARIVSMAIQLIGSFRQGGHYDPDVFQFETLAGNSQFTTPLFRGLWEADYVDRFIEPRIAGYPTWIGHFYDPATGENYTNGRWLMGDRLHTARSEGERYFNVSVHYARRLLQVDSAQAGPILDRAGYYLGLALHFFTDLTQPMHAANFTNVFGEYGRRDDLMDRRHSHFEEYVEHLVVYDLYLDRAPQLVPSDLDIPRTTSTAGDLLHDVAVENKQVWDSSLRAIAAGKSFSETDWSDAHDAIDRSLLSAPKRVARFLRYWMIQAQRPAAIDPRQTYSFERQGKRIALKGGWFRMADDSGGNTRFFVLFNDDGTCALACTDWMENLWTLKSAATADVTWIGEGNARDQAITRFRVILGPGGRIRFYETGGDEAATVFWQWGSSSNDSLCRWDQCAFERQQFVPFSEGSLSPAEQDKIKRSWSDFGSVTWAGVRRSPTSRSRWVTRYRPELQDTLDGIAERLGLDIYELQAVNPYHPDPTALASGKPVNVPAPFVTVRAGQTLAQIAVAHGTETNRLLDANPQLPGSEAVAAGQQLSLDLLPYVSREGDTLSEIARRFNTEVGDVYEANMWLSETPPAGTSVSVPFSYGFEFIAERSERAPAREAITPAVLASPSGDRVTDVFGITHTFALSRLRAQGAGFIEERPHVGALLAGGPAALAVDPVGDSRTVYAITSTGRLVQLRTGPPWHHDFPAEGAGQKELVFAGAPVAIPVLGSGGGIAREVFATTRNGRLARVLVDGDRCVVDFPAEMTSIPDLVYAGSPAAMVFDGSQSQRLVYCVTAAGELVELWGDGEVWQIGLPADEAGRRDLRFKPNPSSHLARDSHGQPFKHVMATTSDGELALLSGYYDTLRQLRFPGGALRFSGDRGAVLTAPSHEATCYMAAIAADDRLVLLDATGQSVFPAEAAGELERRFAGGVAATLLQSHLALHAASRDGKVAQVASRTIAQPGTPLSEWSYMEIGSWA